MIDRHNKDQKIKKEIITFKGLHKCFKLYKYIKPFQVEYALGIVLLFVTSTTTLAFPKLMGDLVNSGNSGKLVNNINQTALLLLGLLFLQAVFMFFQAVMFSNITEKILANLRQSTYNHLIKLPLKFFEQHRVGELNSRISSDVNIVQDTLTNTLTAFIRETIIILGGITLLATTSIKLTLFMLVIIPPMYIIVYFFGRFIRKFSKILQAEFANSNTIIEETLQGIQSVKTYTNESLEIARYKKKTQEIAKIGITSGKFRGAFSSLITFGINGGIIAVIWKGCVYMSEGEIDSGRLIAFVVYSVIIGGNITGMANSISQFQKFIGATEDFFEIIETEEEILVEKKDLSHKEPLKGNIEFRNLSFSYPSRPDHTVLQNINVNIPKDQMIALVGPSGGGKTTFASLLLHLHEPIQGQILFDGIDSRIFSLSWLRRQIALVPQDIFLFGGTIRENIAYGKPDATDAEIYEAAQKANASEFIECFPEKFETLVGERGTQLSGGQRQRIAIARAVLKDPRILILDEATSSLDSESERLVQDALEKLMKGRTSIVIAHRLSTIRKADQILVLELGQLIEKGTHDELIQLDEGLYRNLSELQYVV